MSIAYYNGEFCDFNDIRIPLTDRSIFFGDAIYDAAIGENGRIYLEDEHLERFFANAKRLSIPITVSKTHLSELLHEIMKKSGFTGCFLYFQLSRFSDSRAHAYPNTSKSNLLITVKEHTLPDIEKRLKLITTEDRRYSMCDIKTTNLLPAVIASTEAERHNSDEAVFIRGDTVTECAHSNIAIIKNGILLTHPTDCFILPGITRARLLYICEKLQIPYCELPFSREELFSADEVIVTSTTKLALIASEIDGITFNPHKTGIAKRLISSLRADYVEKIVK